MRSTKGVFYKKQDTLSKAIRAGRLHQRDKKTADRVKQKRTQRRGQSGAGE